MQHAPRVLATHRHDIFTMRQRRHKILQDADHRISCMRCGHDITQETQSIEPQPWHPGPPSSRIKTGMTSDAHCALLTSEIHCH
jgi:hypothetical protein